MTTDRSVDDVIATENTMDVDATLPLRTSVSGLYTTRGTILPGVSQTTAIDLTPPPIRGIPPIRTAVEEELRLDVDRWYPQMTASGVIRINALQRFTWIASLDQTARLEYSGGIWYREPGTTPFAYTNVRIVVRGAVAKRQAIVTFSGGGMPDLVRSYGFRSPYFHRVELELDCCEGITPVTAIDTGAHPNHPPTLTIENLAVDTVFRRAGFDTGWSPNPSIVPVSEAGANAKWNDSELHDAMTVYWSRFANRPQWALWAFIANQHDMGSSLGGIMFDDIGPSERQGTAIFYDSFISDPPVAGDPAPAAFVARNRFWTAVHEIGHTFNLAHSWQKSLGTAWIPLADEPEVRSFMNYPYRVIGGQDAFFADFEYRFSDSELLFMRHAPGAFVEMGAAAWFDQHGFRQATTHPQAPLSLEMRTNRGEPSFEFLEPIVVELKLKNITNEPQLVDEHILEDLDRIVVALKREGIPARQYLPFAQRCHKPTNRVLMPNEAIYTSVFVWAGLNGLDLAEPGRYVLQAGLQTDLGMIISNALTLRVTIPKSREEERLAQDFLTKDVGRVLAFDGSRELREAVDTLQTVVEKLPERRVARHARVALGSVAIRPYKVLVLPETIDASVASLGAVKGVKIRALPVKVEEGRKELAAALTQSPDVAAESLGHIDYKCYVDTLTDFLAAHGDRKEATTVQTQLHKTLAARGVLKRVLKDVENRRDSYGTTAAGR